MRYVARTTQIIVYDVTRNILSKASETSFAQGKHIPSFTNLPGEIDLVTACTICCYSNIVEPNIFPLALVFMSKKLDGYISTFVLAL
jgi:hypothetical protein